MTSQDELWKAAIEEFLDEFMQFFFSDYYHQIDDSREYEVMDKELSRIYPETAEIKRRGDKLIKVPLKEGHDQFVLAHLEVQGYKDLDYGRRMYVCQYRIDERFNLPITALVIYSDKNKQNRENNYERICMGTKLLYEFPTYVIADRTTAEYEAMDNIFAVICQVVLIALERNLTDEKLLDLKVQLFRKLLSKKYSKKRIRLLYTFIKEYKNFVEPEFYTKFDDEIDKITENKEFMGIEETVINYRTREAVAKARVEAEEKGLEKGKLIEGIKVGALKDYTSIMKAFIELPNLTVAQITAFSEVKEAKIKKLKTTLAYSSTEKMQKGILQLFFKNIELPAKDLKKVFALAEKYRSQASQN